MKSTLFISVALSLASLTQAESFSSADAVLCERSSAKSLEDLTKKHNFKSDYDWKSVTSTTPDELWCVSTKFACYWSATHQVFACVEEKIPFNYRTINGEVGQLEPPGGVEPKSSDSSSVMDMPTMTSSATVVGAASTTPTPGAAAGKLGVGMGVVAAAAAAVGVFV